MEPPFQQTVSDSAGATPPLSPARTQGFDYDAFASYSTGADYRLVRRVEGFLESFYQLPNSAGKPLPKLELCVDGSDFSIAAAAEEAARRPGASKEQIKDEIQRIVAEKLGQSRRLLLFCPGRERQGRWMDWEINWWETNRGWGSVFIVITAGGDPWSDAKTFFPDAVIRNGLHGRIGYDLRGHQPWWRRWRWKGKRDFDEELSRMAADLYNLPLGEVLPIWFRQRRQRLRVMIRISITIAIAMAMLASYALLQRQLADSRRIVAERQTRLATARQLAAQSSAALGQGFPQRSLLLAAEALEITRRAGELRIVDAEQALRDGLARTGGTPLAGHEAPIETLATSPDGRWLATGAEDGRALLWNLTTKAALLLGERSSAVKEARFSPDGRWLATVRRDGIVEVWELEAADFAKAARITDAQPLEVVKILFSPHGRWLAITREGGKIALLDLQAPDAPARLLVKHRNPVTDLAFTPDETRLVTASDKQHFSEAAAVLTMEAGALVWDLREPEPKYQVLLGHEGAVECLCISPGGRWLITGGRDGTVAVWDLGAQPVTRKWALPGHSASGVGAVAAAAGDRWVASGGHDGIVRLWDLQSANPAQASAVLTGHVGTVSTVEFSPDGSRLLTHATNEADARLWEMGADGLGERRWVLRGHTGAVQVVHFSGGARWVLTAGDDKVARLWDLQAVDPAGAPLVFAGHEDPVAAAAVSADGRWLAVASGPLESLPRRDRTARVWELRSPQPAASPERLAVDAEGGEATVGADGAWIATPAAGFKVRLWRRSDSAMFLLDAATERLSVVTFSDDGHWLAAASEDGTARLWDLTQTDPAARSFHLQPNANALLRAVFSPDGRWLATGDNENTATLWDLRAPDPSQAGHPLRGHEDGIMALAWSADGRLLATGSDDHTAKVWDTRSTAPSAPIWTLGGHAEGVNRAAFSPNGRWLVTTELYRGTVRVWDLQAANPGENPAVLIEHGSEVQAVTLSPDGRWLATASRDDEVKLQPLPPADGRSAVSLPARTGDARDPALAFSPDGRWLAATGAEDTAQIWDLHAQPLATRPFRTLVGHGDDVTAFAFTPDSAQVITGSSDGTARIWSLAATARDELPVVLAASPRGEVLSLDVCAGGQRLVTGASDAIRLWPLGIETLGKLARSTAGRELRPEEAAAFLPPPAPAPATWSERLGTWRQRFRRGWPQ